MTSYRRPALGLGACFSVLLLLPPAAQAVAPSTMSYQGQLTDEGGVNVPDGPYALTFRLYDVASGGAALWTESQPGVTIADGLFSVVLGSTTPLALPFDQQYWLGISVGADPEMAPRTPLTSVPYAMATRTPVPGVAHFQFPGTYSVIGNANIGNPIQLHKDYSVDLTAPADGFVVVSATGYVTMVLVPVGTSQYCLVQLSETTGNPSNFVDAVPGKHQWIGIQQMPNGGYWNWSMGVQRVFPVTAGAHSFSICSARFGSFSPTSTTITSLSLLATYYPASYGSVASAPGVVPAAVHPLLDSVPR